MKSHHEIIALTIGALSVVTRTNPAHCSNVRLNHQKDNERQLQENVDVALEWNQVGLDVNIEDHGGAHVPGDQLTCTQGPPSAAFQLASMHLAMFDAYNSIFPHFEPYAMVVENTDGASVDVAVAKAAHDVLFARYPLQRVFIGKALNTTLAREPSGQARRRGIRVGRRAARGVLKKRSDDKSCVYGRYKYKPSWEVPSHQDDPVTPGIQVPISPGFGFNAKPFAVKNMDNYTGVPPPPLDSPEYAAAHKQVRVLGGDGRKTSTKRTNLQTVIGWYHSYNGSPELGTPNALVNEVARLISIQKRLDVGQNVRLFALMNAAMADGGMASWRDKFTFDFWRPVIGIRRANEDGNAKTVQDEDWTPLGAARSNPFPGECNFSPPFPSYTSGHATFCGAGIKTLINFLQTNDVKFDFVSKEFNGQTYDDRGRVRPLLEQTFESLSIFSSQCAASRIFNGVHWSFDGTVGAQKGYDIADYIWVNMLKPKGLELTPFNDIPSVDDEIQDILNDNIKVHLRSPFGFDVEDVIAEYLHSKPKRFECVPKK